MPRLRRLQVAIEDDQVRPQRHRAHEDFLQLAASHDGARIDLAPPLEDDVEDLHAGRAGKLAQFLQRILRGAPPFGENADEDRAALDADLAHRRRAGHLRFQRLGSFQRVELEVLHRRRRLLPVQLAAGVEGQERR